MSARRFPITPNFKPSQLPFGGGLLIAPSNRLGRSFDRDPVGSVIVACSIVSRAGQAASVLRVAEPRTDDHSAKGPFEVVTTSALPQTHRGPSRTTVVPA